MYKKDKTDDYNNYVWNHKLELKVTQDNSFTTLEISKKIEIRTPILNKVFKNPYLLSESMTIYES